MKNIQPQDPERNGLRTFDFQGKSPVRTVTIDGEAWFFATDVAKTLGYAQPEKAIRTHCKGVSKTDTPSPGGHQTVNIIREGDVFRLVMKSKLPEAQAFEAWVMDEVLPALRKNGTYTMPGIDRRPKLSGAWIQRTREQVGLTNTTEAMIRIWPEWFANLPGPFPNPPQQVVTPTLGLVELVLCELRPIR